MNEVKEIARLNWKEYERLEALVGITMGHSTTDTEAAYMLGQQSVLAILRKGYVVGSRSQPSPPPPGGA